MDSKYRYVATYPEKLGTTCRVCKKETQKSFQLFQKYIAFLGLPLFPTRQIIYWSCEACTVRKEVKISENFTIDNLEGEIAQSLKVSHPSSKSIRYYWGSLLILSILTLITCAIVSN